MEAALELLPFWSEDVMPWGAPRRNISMLAVAEVLQDYLPLDLVRLVVPLILDDEDPLTWAVRAGAIDEVRFIHSCTLRQKCTYPVDGLMEIAVKRDHLELFKLLCEGNFTYHPTRLLDSFKLALKLKKWQFAQYCLSVNKMYFLLDPLEKIFGSLSKGEMQTFMCHCGASSLKVVLQKRPHFTVKFFKAAVFGGHVAVVKFIIENKEFKSRLRKNDLAQAVTTASFRNHAPLVRYLAYVINASLEHTKEEMLVKAVVLNKPAMVRWLLSKGADIAWCSYNCIRETLHKKCPHGTEALKIVAPLCLPKDHMLLDADIQRAVQSEDIDLIESIAGFSDCAQNCAAILSHWTCAHAQAIQLVLQNWSTNWRLTPLDVLRVLVRDKRCECGLRSWFFKEIKTVVLVREGALDKEHMSKAFILDCPYALRQVLALVQQSATESKQAEHLATDLLFYAFRLSKLKSVKILVDQGADLKMWYADLANYVKPCWTRTELPEGPVMKLVAPDKKRVEALKSIEDMLEDRSRLEEICHLTRVVLGN